MARAFEDIFAAVFDIEFVGGEVKQNIHIRNPVITTDGAVLWLEDINGVMYNWTTIIKMVEISRPRLN